MVYRNQLKYELYHAYMYLQFDLPDGTMYKEVHGAVHNPYISAFCLTQDLRRGRSGDSHGLRTKVYISAFLFQLRSCWVETRRSILPSQDKAFPETVNNRFWLVIQYRD